MTYIDTYIYMCVYVYIHIYVYVFTHTHICICEKDSVEAFVSKVTDRRTVKYLRLAKARRMTSH